MLMVMNSRLSGSALDLLLKLPPPGCPAGFSFPLLHTSLVLSFWSGHQARVLLWLSFRCVVSLCRNEIHFFDLGQSYGDPTLLHQQRKCSALGVVGDGTVLEHPLMAGPHSSLPTSRAACSTQTASNAVLSFAN